MSRRDQQFEPRPGFYLHSGLGTPLSEMSTEEAYDWINQVITPEVLEHFMEKQKDYSGGPSFLFLGSKGQFSDINRKFWKLYAALWEGRELEGEQAEELLKDFVGHCLLAIFTLRREEEE